MTIIVDNQQQFLEAVASTAPETRIKIDRRPTIEVGFRSEKNRYGEAYIVDAPRRIERIERFLQTNTRRLAMTESGDVWPYRLHKNPQKADYYALGGA